MFRNNAYTFKNFPVEEKQRKWTDCFCTICTAIFALSLFILSFIMFHRSIFILQCREFLGNQLPRWGLRQGLQLRSIINSLHLLYQSQWHEQWQVLRQLMSWLPRTHSVRQRTCGPMHWHGRKPVLNERSHQSTWRILYCYRRNCCRAHVEFARDSSQKLPAQFFWCDPDCVADWVMRWNNIPRPHYAMPQADDLHCIRCSLHFPVIRRDLRFGPPSQVLLSQWVEHRLRNLSHHYSSVLPNLYGMLSKIIRTMFNLYASRNKIS